MVTTPEVVSAECVLKSFNGNLSRAAAYLGISLPTLRKYRDNGDLGKVLLINNSVYYHHHDIYPETSLVFETAEWIRVSNTEVPATSSNSNYKTTIEDGKVVYWKRNN